MVIALPVKGDWKYRKGRREQVIIADRKVWDVNIGLDIDGHMDGHMDRHMDGHMEGHMDGHMDEHMDGRKDG